MKLHLEIVGALLIVLGLAHAIFPRYFNWKAVLKGLPLISRQITYVHCLFIGLTVLLLGILYLTSSELLITTQLGRRICLGSSIFWAVRLFIQLFGFSSLLWKGKRFETAVHLVFTLFWLDLSLLFLVATFR